MGQPFMDRRYRHDNGVRLGEANSGYFDWGQQGRLCRGGRVDEEG
jgi:hypothetical protein